mmetsp:Transcript_17380/g.30279  ORF Transcript_17380/g.30279 Transcript_17380/m.30279 type:complete len:153 (-) Transcript_17380:671-1129(-)
MERHLGSSFPSPGSEAHPQKKRSRPVFSGTDDDVAASRGTVHKARDMADTGSSLLISGLLSNLPSRNPELFADVNGNDVGTLISTEESVVIAGEQSSKADKGFGSGSEYHEIQPEFGNILLRKIYTESLSSSTSASLSKARNSTQQGSGSHG